MTKKLPKKPVKKRPKNIKKVGITEDITQRQLQNLAKKAAFLQHSASLADLRYKQQLIREFKKAYEDYIG